MRWTLHLVPVAVVAIAGCASLASVKASVRDEMKAGVQAGQHGYWQEALFRFERARTLKPDDPDILNDVAVSLEALGRYDEALATYKQSLQLNPRNTYVRRNYARFAEFYTSYARGVLPKGVFDAKH
ncbi:MAG: tetratricopeptide repeat protein [Acidobacteriota bacterium]